jgi:hypothetical protein
LTRILNPGTSKATATRRRSVRGMFGLGQSARSGSWHDDSLPRATGRSSIRRLFVRDPYNKNSSATQATFAPEAEQFSHAGQTNPNYDPSKAPGSVQKKDGTPQPPAGANSGHQKVIRRTLFNQNAGKRLIKRR